MSIKISIKNPYAVGTGTLYIVATPIGNLGDISTRAIEMLKLVEVIAAEDTRHSQRLLSYLGISTHMQAYHEHNEEQQAGRLIARLLQGESVAIISDAGTPLVSDPGYRLVAQAHEQGIKVVPIPGSCAAIAAMSAAGLPSDHFCFEGFPPARQAARLKYLQLLSEESRTMVFYISCHRVVETLEDMKAVFGQQRPATFARELTKTYETIRKASLGELCAWVAEDEMQSKGEMVLVVSGSVKEKSVHPLLDEILQALVDELPIKQAAKIASKITGVNKNELYEAAIKLKNKDD
ncbi:MAG: 16S rRNA (cytidine(1402)-2'-O)-methyltransferase [Gammaproteobacteria bacterium]|nr:16S rRNA (cytidine(1402)-2'-O)-methyltransferase [Gammaproteobacteria bacterium]